MSGVVQPDGDGAPLTVEIFAAACTGAGRLCGALGLPVVHVDVTCDVAAAIISLNARAHGSAVRAPDSFQPLHIESGWDDWALFEISGGSLESATPGVDLVLGRIRVTLPAGATKDEFREQLHAALRHLRLQEATIRSDFLESRSDALMNVISHPRYTLRAPDADYRGAALCTDLYCIDPAEYGWRLIWLATAARLATIERARPSWR